MSEPITITALLVWLKSMVPAFLGALVGAFQNREKPLLERFIAIFTGIVVAHYAGTAIISYWDITSPHSIDGIKFVLGLFGMNLVYSIREQISPFVKSVSDRVSSLIGGEK
jgi:uncharacterized membrane protein YeaQ/YmgE (transglycosylase-associated protein family)